MLILIFGSKSGFGDDFGQYDTKTTILCPFMVLFCQTPLRNSIVMATPKVPGDQKLFERVNYMLKLKVTKFQLRTPYGYLSCIIMNPLSVDALKSPLIKKDKKIILGQRNLLFPSMMYDVFVYYM